MRVLLERMPHRENRLFPDERRPRALQRAQTLADLHGCKFTEDSENAAIIVHAAEWYAPKVGDRLKMYPGNDPEGGPKQWHTWTGTSWQSDEEKEMYVRTHYPESFEDDGDAESGPHLTGGPAYDEYESADDRVIIDHNGHFAHHEKRDLEWEAHCDAMYQAEQTHARL
jgi:hypothetical protein